MDFGKSLPASTIGNETVDEAYNELPDWTELYKQAGGNTTEIGLRAEYFREYRKHHENDPEVKYAVLIFYAIMVGITSIRPGSKEQKNCIYCPIT